MQCRDEGQGKEHRSRDVATGLRHKTYKHTIQPVRHARLRAQRDSVRHARDQRNGRGAHLDRAPGPRGGTLEGGKVDRRALRRAERAERAERAHARGGRGRPD